MSKALTALGYQTITGFCTMVALIWLVPSVCYLVMYQIPFLYKGLLIFDKLIWIIPSVFYLVPYQIIFQYKGLLPVAVLAWFSPSVY